MKKNKAPLPQLPPEISLIDTHCHLDMDDYGTDVEAVVRAAADHGVHRIITVGIDIESSQKAVALAGRFANVWAAVGIHPHNAAAAGTEVLNRLAALAADPANKVVGYGEIGLDFARNYAPREVQTDAFAAQLRLAGELGLPIIIHDRDAHEATMHLLKKYAPFPAGGVMHCFSGDLALARQVIELGFFVSIPGIVTFNRSDQLQKVAKEMPLEYMILETDGPFLAPVPFRGKINRPEYLLYTAQKIAELRSIPLKELALRTTRNAEDLFRFDS